MPKWRIVNRRWSNDIGSNLIKYVLDAFGQNSNLVLLQNNADDSIGILHLEKESPFARLSDRPHDTARRWIESMYKTAHEITIESAKSTCTLSALRVTLSAE
jgi:hypothetical protein